MPVPVSLCIVLLVEEIYQQAIMSVCLTFIAIKTYFIKGRKKKLSSVKEPGGSSVKPESVTVSVDTDQTIPNATESDNLMNESHKMEKEVLRKESMPAFSAVLINTLPGAVVRSEACPLGMQAAQSSISTSGTIFRGDLVMKKFLRPFSLFR